MTAHGVSGPRGVGSAMLDKNVEKLLSEPWGAAKVGVHYTKEVLGSLCEQFSRLEPQARRGALQGTLFMRKGQRSGLNDEVEDLVAVATDDKDQWASLIARALGGLKQRFDLQRLQQDVPAVADALASIREKIQVEGTPDTYRPLEEAYLSPKLLEVSGAPPVKTDGAETHAHFTMRQRKQPKKRLISVSSSVTLKPSSASSVTPSHATQVGGSMFAPPSRKPNPAAASFLRNTSTKRPADGPAGGLSAKDFLKRKQASANRSMMIDVQEAAKLGTVMGEDLRREEEEREKKKEREERELKRKQEQEEREARKLKEQEEKQRRIQRMMQEREQKKAQEAEKKRLREEERAAAAAAKRMRTASSPDQREGVATPSPDQEPIPGF